MLASIFADGILLRGNLMAKAGVRPLDSGTKKFASDSLIRPWSLDFANVSPLKSPV